MTLNNSTQKYGNDYVYVNPSSGGAYKGYYLSLAASGLISSTLPLFSKPFMKQVPKEHANNELYRDYLDKALEKSGLKKQGVRFVHEEMPKFKVNMQYVENADTKAGLNAFYKPAEKTIHINKDKICIAGFHEIGHAMNHLQSKFGKALQKMRGIGYTVSGIMGMIALISNRKPRDEKRGVMSFLQDNCAKITFISMLPLVIEEALATHKGLKLAKQSGMKALEMKHLKKFYGKALLTYIGRTLVTTAGVWVTNKIMDKFTRPKKVYINPNWETQA